MVFRRSLSDSNSSQVSRTLLSILVDINNAALWTVSTCSIIFKSPSPFTNPLVTVPRALITTGIIVTFMFHSFFNSLARSWYLFLFSHSFILNMWSARTTKWPIQQVLAFFSINIWPGRLVDKV